MDDIQLRIKELSKRIEPNYIPTIDVDEGWYELVLSCHQEILAVDPHYKLLQIKEKFGGLRYYVEPSELCYEPRRIGEIILKYEDIASRTCEATGGPGVLMKSIGGWYKTLNPGYAEKSLHYAKYSVVNKKEEE